MTFILMRRTAVLLCLLATLQRAVGQTSIGNFLPCEAAGEDPDPLNPRDNLACLDFDDNEIQCFSSAQLCNGEAVCPGGHDEGMIVGFEDCDVFPCGPNENVELNQLCDGVGDCSNGDDETNFICANKCLLPYYGGCSYSRQCRTATFQFSCGNCLPGFVTDPSNTGGDCLVEIGLERNTYNGREMDETTEEICVVVFADPSDFANDTLEDVFSNVGISTISVLITPTADGSATATDDFNAEPLTVNLDSTQLRDCVQIPIVEDALLDPNEMFSVVLTTNTPGVVVRSGRDSAQVIIDPPLDVRVVYQETEYTTSEGSSFLPCVAITSPSLTRLPADSTVSVTFADGPPPTATTDDDYTPSPVVVLFSTDSIITDSPATTSTRCFNVPIIDDDIIEGSETFILGLASPTDLLIIPPDSQVPVTINDNDRPVVGFNPVVYVAEEEMGEDLEVCIEIFTSGNPNPVELLISTAEASATAPEDYEPLNNRLLTFPAQSMMGDTACTNIVILNDDIPETPPEMFFANIMSDDADIEIGRSQANITLQDTGDTVTFIIEEDYVVDERDVPVSVCVIVSSGTLFTPVNITLTSVDDSAVAGSDYVIVDILLEFTTSTRMCGQISIINDELVESDEQFNLTISVTPPISGAVIGNDGMATVTIMDSDVVLVQFMPPFSVDIAEDGGSVTFCVTLITGVLSSGQTATVTLTTMDGTAEEPGDYTRQQVDLDFSDIDFVKGNEVTSCVNVPIINDDLCEETEMFTILLSEADPNVALNGPRQGTVTIIDDDVAEIGLRLPVAECEADGVWIRLDYATLVRKGADRVCEVSVRTEDGTAMAGSDFSSLDETCVFSDANPFCEFHIDVTDDGTVESAEEFSVLLSSNDQSGCIIENDRITVTIRDNATCTGGCVNGCCRSPGDCVCDRGWRGSSCATPVCSPDCVFGRCSSPGVCSCNEGYEGGVCDSGGRRTVESSLYVVMAGIIGLVFMTVM